MSNLKQLEYKVKLVQLKIDRFRKELKDIIAQAGKMKNESSDDYSPINTAYYAAIGRKVMAEQQLEFLLKEIKKLKL